MNVHMCETKCVSLCVCVSVCACVCVCVCVGVVQSIRHQYGMRGTFFCVCHIYVRLQFQLLPGRQGDIEYVFMSPVVWE